MKKHKLLTIAGLILSGHLIINQGLVAELPEVKAEKVSVTSKIEKKSKEQKQIVVIIEILKDGYKQLAGEETFFVKGDIPKDAKFVETLLPPKEYVFNKEDVVKELDKGVIIKIKDKYYYYTTKKGDKGALISLKEAKKLTKNVKNPNKSAKKKVPGVDVPTDDGFLLTNDKDIIAKTEDGIIVNHDGHAHFIYYSDLKDSKWAYLIPKAGTKVTATIPKNPVANSHIDDGYVFNPKDIVAEDANGYTVKHGDHYHYIWKSSVANTSSVTATIKPEVSQFVPVKEEKQAIAGIDYATSDGFLFDGSGIRGWTDLGLIVDHGEHTHLILKNDLVNSKWAHLLSTAPDSTVKEKKEDQLGSEDHTSSPKKILDSDVSTADDSMLSEVNKKRIYLANATGLSVDKIVYLDIPEGPAFMYPHEDHNHVILLSKIDLTKPFEDGHDQHKHVSENHINNNNDNDNDNNDDTDQNKKNPSTVKTGVAGIDYPTSDGFLFNGTGIVGWTSAGLLVTHDGHTHILSKDAIAQSKWAHLLPKEVEGTVSNSIDLPENLVKQRESLAKQFNLAVEAIRVVTADGKVVGFEYPHEDHYDFVPITEEDKTSVQLTEDEKKELKAYIRKTYGLLIGTPVTFHDNLVVFAIPHPHQDYDANKDYYSDVPDPNYDASHVHPYFVPLSRLSIPAITGIPEIDFENELKAAAKRLGVSPSEVAIKDDKYFILPGKDHDHYLNILTSKEGYENYKNNKLPEIKAHFSQGAYSQTDVFLEADRILSKAESQFGGNTVEYRRVARALEDFKSNLTVGTTSTEAYIQALQSFENRHLKGEEIVEEKDQQSDEYTNRYAKLVDQLKAFGPRVLRTYGLIEDEMIKTLQTLVANKDDEGLTKIENHFKAVDRTEKAPSDMAPRLAYMDYFLRNLNNNRLPVELRQRLAVTLDDVYKNPRTFKKSLADLSDLKWQVQQTLANNETTTYTEPRPYLAGFNVNEVVSYVNQMRDFVIRMNDMTSEELANGFDQPLSILDFTDNNPKSTTSTESIKKIDENASSSATEKEESTKPSDQPIKDESDKATENAKEENVEDEGSKSKPDSLSESTNHSENGKPLDSETTTQEDDESSDSEEDDLSEGFSFLDDLSVEELEELLKEFNNLDRAKSESSADFKD